MNILSALTVISGSGLVAVLLNLLIVLLILGLIYYIITILPLPPIFLKVAQIVFAIVVILYLASLLTGCEGMDATVTGGASGVTHGVDGKDINWDAHSTVHYVKPTPTPKPEDGP